MEQRAGLLELRWVARTQTLIDTQQGLFMTGLVLIFGQRR